MPEDTDDNDASESKTTSDDSILESQDSTNEELMRGCAKCRWNHLSNGKCCKDNYSKGLRRTGGTRAWSIPDDV
jgi:radical SAM protein with 4Fe4S-binding SPASM domain